MINIKTLHYEICFLNDIVFVEDAELVFLKIIYSRLKNILCINKIRDCSRCSHANKCLYNYMSSGDFVNLETIPVILQRTLFSKKFFKRKEKLDLNFTFLGEATKHIDFFNYILKEIEIKGLFKEGYKFVIQNKELINHEIKKSSKKVKYIEILSLVDTKYNIIEKEKIKIKELNKLYNFIDDTLIDSMNIEYNTNFIKLNFKNSINIGNKRVKQKGYVGKINFKKPALNNSILQILEIIGMGKLYGLGGGNIKLNFIF